MQHEKYSSQLQMSLKVSDGHKAELEEQTRGEKLSSTKTGQQGAHAKHTFNLHQESKRWCVMSPVSPIEVISSCVFQRPR